MNYRILGRTGLKVSLMGLGTGGPSLFGQQRGVSEAEAGRLLRRALELGINFFDSSAQYRDSEAMLGRALVGVPRSDYILATKFMYAFDGRFAEPAAVRTSVEQSLLRLKVDAIDILQFHGIKPDEYRQAMETYMPVVTQMQEEGKFRFLGLSENYSHDPEHLMLPMALEDDAFDTAMVGYNLLSPAPEAEILPICQELKVGVICMVAVRMALSRPERLRENLADAVARGVIPAEALTEGEEPLSWLLEGPAESLPAAGYKYVAAHPAIGTVLTGTADLAHLESNVRAILGPSLSQAHMERLRRIFGQVREPLAN
jgi:L-galactose dehydrogenase